MAKFNFADKFMFGFIIVAAIVIGYAFLSRRGVRAGQNPPRPVSARHP